MQLLARFSSDVLELNPGYVVIKFCSGNFMPSINIERMWDEYEMMARMAKDRGISPILATVVPVCKSAEVYGDYKITPNLIIFNSKIKEFARANNMDCVDYYSALANNEGFLPDEWAKDSIHPNDRGYEKMAKVIEGFLK
jgi:lysophospholipase L1-like esterase